MGLNALSTNLWSGQGSQHTGGWAGIQKDLDRLEKKKGQHKSHQLQGQTAGPAPGVSPVARATAVQKRTWAAPCTTSSTPVRGAPLQQKRLPMDTGAGTGKTLLPYGQLSPEPTRRTGPTWGQGGHDQAAMKSQEDLQVRRQMEHRAHKGRLTQVAWASLNEEGQGNSIPLPSAIPRETQEEMQTDYLQRCIVTG